MGYDGVWQVLADLVTKLRKKGATIPADVVNDLRSAKTMIEVLKADPSHSENVQRIEIFLGNVEFRLISMAQERLGSEDTELWMRKVEEARREVHEEEAAPRFVPGTPRGKHWVRVQITEDTPEKCIRDFAEENGLSIKVQEGGYVLVYGQDKNIRSFVKKMAEKFRSARKS